MVEHLKKWWAVYGGVLVTIGTPVVTAVLPVAQAWISKHAVAVSVINGIGWVIAALKKSPSQ